MLLFLLGLGLCLWISLLLILSCIGLAIDINISTFSVWMINILFITLFSLYLFKKENINLKKIVIYWINFIGIVAVSVAFVSYFYDYSYDGQAYHGKAVMLLSNGWNPFDNYLPEDNVNLYINHYCQGPWITYCCFYKMFQNYEIAKIVNLLLMIATFGICYYTLKIFKLKNWITIVLALLIAFHPVCLNMYLGMYIDGQLADLIAVMICVFILWIVQGKNLNLLLLMCFSVIYLINIKFTVLGYVLLFCGFFGLYLIWTKSFKANLKPILWVCGAILFGTLFIGYSSYVKNTIYFQNPFYPLETNTTYNNGALFMAPKTFSENNRVTNFTKAMFAKTGYSNYYNQPLNYKIPFSISKYELERYAFSGVMIGGMGVWFSGILILGFLMYIIAFIHDKNSKRKWGILYLSLALFGSCFILQAPWWARYAPQLFLLPIIALIYFNIIFPKFKIITYTFIGILSINSFLIGAPYSYYNMIVTPTIKEQYQKLKDSQKSYYVDFQQSPTQEFYFKKYQIPYIKKSADTFPTKPDTIFRSSTVYCECF